MENEPKVFIETIDLDKAVEYLKKNKGNRPLRQWHVKSFENHLKEGTFLDFAETLKFDTDDFLIDGQHRLNAIANTRISSKFIVIKNLPKEVGKVIDQGAVRSVTDILAMSNDGNLKDIKYLSSKVAITKKLFNGFGVLKEDRTSNGEQATFIKDKTDLLEDFIRVFDDAPNGLGKTVFKAAFINHSLMNPSKKDTILELAKCFVGKAQSGFAKKDALYKLTIWHQKMSQKLAKSGGDPRSSLVYAHALQAVDDQINNRNIKLVECRFDAFSKTKYTQKGEEE